MTSAIPRANASVASGSRTGTTLSNPDSVRDFSSSEASVLASSLQVTPMECRRWPRVAAIASLRSTAAAACSEVCAALDRPRKPDLECVAVHGGAVGVLPFDEDEADGGRRYR